MSDGYSKSLKSRKWKTKRKRIIFRDGNKCTNCGSNENLCVHHIYYYKEKVQPWDYPDDALITLCEKCHNEWHKYNKNIYRDNDGGHVIKKRVRKNRTRRPIPKKTKRKRDTRYKGPSLAKTQKNSHTNKYRKKVNGEWVIIEKYKD